MTMKNMIITAILCAAACLFFGYQQGVAAGDKIVMPAKIGVVEIAKVLQNCKKHTAWLDKMKAEQDRLKAEFQKTQKELETLQASMELYKVGSDDYIKTMGDFLDKKGLLESKNKFYEEKSNLQLQQWTEALYTDVLKIIAKVGQQKGLDMILSQEQLDLPAPSLRDFMLNIRTKKVLYNAESLDITADVLAAVDSELQ